MPAPKSLERHCIDETFRPRRHHELLAGPAVRWPALAALQGRYAAATSDAERRAIAIDFLHALRAGATVPPGLDAILSQIRVEDIDAGAQLDTILNAPPTRYLTKSHVSGSPIEHGSGAVVDIAFANEEKGVWTVDVTDEEAEALIGKGHRLEITKALVRVLKRDDFHEGELLVFEYHVQPGESSDAVARTIAAALDL